MNIKVLVLATICSVATDIHAADNCTGAEATVDTYTETFQVSKDHSLTVVRSASVVMTEDAPMYNLTSGECTASVLATPDGKTQATGHCLRHDKDGDTWSLEWTQPSGTDKGTWKTVGGTGKFAGKHSSGWFQEVRRDGKLGAIKWGGSCN